MSYAKDFDAALALVKDFHDNLVAETKRVGNTNFPQPLKLHPYNMTTTIPFVMNNTIASLFNNRNYYGTEIEPKTVEEFEKKRDALIASIDDYTTQFAKIRELNVGVVDHNKAVAHRIRECMKSFGMPATYLEVRYPSSRSRTSKTRTTSAGYEGDITRNVPTSDYSATEIAMRINMRLDAVRTYAADNIRSINDLQEAAKIVEREKRSEVLFATMRVKYSLDPEAPPKHILSAIIAEVGGKHEDAQRILSFFDHSIRAFYEDPLDFDEEL